MYSDNFPVDEPSAESGGGDPDPQPDTAKKGGRKRQDCQNRPPAAPKQDPAIAKLRDKCLNLHLLMSVGHAREVSEDYRIDYNRRPHSSLNDLTQAEFMKLDTARDWFWAGVIRL